MLLTTKDRIPPASRRWAALAGAGVLGLVVAVSGVGFAAPDDDKVQDPAKADGAKGKAAKPDDKKPAAKPGDVLVGPPAELDALRKAVEAAARKGENVDDIRKQLDALEKALTGKSWTKPQPVEQPPAPVRPLPPAPPLQPGFPNQPFAVPPGFPGGGLGGFGGLGGLDPDALKMAQDLMAKAAEMLANNPEDADALRLMREAQEKLLGGLRGGIARPALPDVPGFAIPGAFAGNPPAGFGVRGGRPAEPRFGATVEKAPSALLDQLDLKGGLVVTDLVKGLPAEKAGLKVNDLLIEFGGKPVADVGEFARMVTGVPKGEKVDVVVVRKGKKDTIKGIELPEAKRGAVPPNPNFGPPGAKLLPLPPPVDGLPEVRIVPLPVPGVGADGGNRLEAIGLGGRGTSVQVSVQDGVFTLKGEQDGVTFVIEGVADDGTPVPSKITITDGEKKVEATSIDKLPAEYRDRAKGMLARIRVR